MNRVQLQVSIHQYYLDYLLPSCLIDISDSHSGLLGNGKYNS